MEKLLDDLIQRWEQAFAELHLIGYYREQVKSIRYADSSRYNVEKFDWTSFPSNGPMIEDKPELKQVTLHEYGFNADGFPCYVKFEHEYNQIVWEGFYTYSDDEVRYLEFCINTGIPSAFTRMVFQDGRKVMLQRLVVNGRGSGYSDLLKDEIVNKLKSDSSSLIITVTRFEYIGDRIDRSSSVHIMPGLGKYTSHDEYAYDETGVLERIRTFFEDGNNRLCYSRNEENVDPTILIDKLASAMASSIAEALTGQNIQSPIALLELNYHYADNYHPLLAWQSAEEIEEKLQCGEYAFINDNYDGPIVDIQLFEDLFVQLEQMMEERDDMELGRIMLRKTAAILTESKLLGKVEVSENFAAYAIDWSIEGHSNEHLVEILLECGVKEDVIELWTQKGMLD